ncbi:MAG: hypothetical protein B6U75_03535 [Desulfurococcales archaeon ex4484_217_1]|nr:MAG: hypothetical protein B6U75_03535 [Desulfurococcales archaeon ex4484_217_1]
MAASTLEREITILEISLYHMLKAFFSDSLEDFAFSIKLLFELEPFKDRRIRNELLKVLVRYAKKKGYTVDDVLEIEDKVGLFIEPEIFTKVYGSKTILA